MRVTFRNVGHREVRRLPGRARRHRKSINMRKVTELDGWPHEVRAQG